MAPEDVLFAGGGSRNAAIMMWADPHESRPLTISRFPAGYSVYALAVSPRGSRIAIGTKVGLLRVHALSGSRAQENAPALFEIFHPPGITSLAFCTDDVLASGNLEGQIKLWSITQRRQLAAISAHHQGVFALRALGSLVLASIGGDGLLRIWDLDCLEVKYESDPFALPRIHALTSLEFNCQTGLLMHPSRNGEIHIYDTHHDFNRRVVPAHQGDCCALACGSQYLVSAGAEDAVMKLWSLNLEELIEETSTPAGTLAVGWAGSSAVMTVQSDGKGQIWHLNGHFTPGRIWADLDIRTTTGLPAELVAKQRTEALRQWRDQKLAEANELLSQPEKLKELAGILEELCRQGFSPEAALVLADAAKAQGKVLWELTTRLALAEGLGQSPAALASLYVVADLLQSLNEVQLSLEYFEKILQIDPDFRDVTQRVAQITQSPLLQLHPATDVRGDLLPTDRLLEELEKYTFLHKKFTWRVIVTTGSPMSYPSVIDPQAVTSGIIDAMSQHDGDSTRAGLVTAQLWSHGELRDLTWAYIPSSHTEPGTAFALEFRSLAVGTELIWYGVFDVHLLDISSNLSPAEHNQKVKDSWLKFSRSSATKRCWANTNSVAMNAIRQWGSQVLAKNDDEF